MDSAEQADGAKRVNQLLIEPLTRRGLARPSSLTKALFADMVKDLCARLAYMSEVNLMALEEQAAARPGGKGKDRFPIGNLILGWAAHIQPPGDEASPLIRAVFAAQVGMDAIAGGWSPELLGELKQARCWPTRFVVGLIQERASDNLRQMQRCEEALARGEVLPLDLERWRARRLLALRKCEDIAALGMNQGTGG